MSTAKWLQQAVVRAGTAIIVRKEFHSTPFYHYVSIDSTPDPDVFTHPLALVKLALFLGDALQERQSRRNERATAARRSDAAGNLVVAVLMERINAYLVVGVSARDTPRHRKYVSLLKSITAYVVISPVGLVWRSVLRDTSRARESSTTTLTSLCWRCRASILQSSWTRCTCSL